MLTLKPVLKLKWVGLQGSRGEGCLLLLKNPWHAILTVDFGFPAAHRIRFRLTTNPASVERSSKLSTNPTWINCLYFQRFYDNDDTSPFRSSKQNLLQTIPQFPLSSRIGRGTYPPQPRHRTVFHLSTIHTTFRLLLRHQNRSRTPSF